MSDWKLSPRLSGGVTYRRELHDRFMAYVDYDLDWEQEEPLFYNWSVQDGSCGRTLESDYVEGAVGLAGAQRLADEAAARLFPGR